MVRGGRITPGYTRQDQLATGGRSSWLQEATISWLQEAGSAGYRRQDQLGTGVQ